jgi:hypothetical protein
MAICPRISRTALDPSYAPLIQYRYGPLDGVVGVGNQTGGPLTSAAPAWERPERELQGRQCRGLGCSEARGSLHQVRLLYQLAPAGAAVPGRGGGGGKAKRLSSASCRGMMDGGALGRWAVVGSRWSGLGRYCRWTRSCSYPYYYWLARNRQ